MIESLICRSSKLCEMDKSRRAATSLDKVLSSGITNRPPFELTLFVSLRLLEALSLAPSKLTKQSCSYYVCENKIKANLVELFLILESFDVIQHHTVVWHMHSVETNEHVR
jgi:hypothetical protein